MSETIETNNPALPSYECEAYKKQLPALQITRDLCGGTLELRQKGEAYLPKEPKEEPGPYEYRRKRAILFNMYERGKAALVGMVFNGEMEIEEDVPEIMRGREAEAETDEVEGQLEDCDRNGTHLSVFAKEFFDNAIDDGHCFLYVDMPPKLPDGATAEDEQRANRRPYFVKYRKDQAVNWRVDARGTLQQITFRECTWEPVGAFGEEEVTRYRVLTPGRWQLFRVVKDERGKMAVIPDPDTPEGETSLSYIPVSVCYTRKMGILHSKPMLLDAALVNVAWWQKYSDYSIYLHINSRPLLWFRDRDQTRPVETIGPYTFFDAQQVDFAEPKGSALGAARTDLQDLQEYMSVLLLSLLAKKTVTKTATEERGDQKKEESDLATAARSLKDCFEQGLKTWAEYLGLPSGGSIRLGEVEEIEIDAQTMTALAGLAGTIFSTETIRQMEAKGLSKLLPDTYTETDEAKRLADEAQAKQDAMPDIGAQIGRAFNAGAM